MKCDIKSQTLEDLSAQFQKWECPTYRVTQLLDWLYDRKVTSWDAMSNLPKNLRERLEHTFSMEILQLVRKQGARDTTQKFLWRLADGAFIESVLRLSPPVVGSPLITQRHKAKLNAPSEICPITQGCEQPATHLRMNSARLLGRRTI